MPISHTFIFLLIAITLSLKCNAQAISNIPTKRIAVALASAPITLIKSEAASDSIRKKPFTYRDNRIPQPLFVANGKVITVKKLAKIDPQRIASIVVFKGEQAIAKFGSQGENGAVVISIKKKKWFSCK